MIVNKWDESNHEEKQKHVAAAAASAMYDYRQISFYIKWKRKTKLPMMV